VTTEASDEARLKVMPQWLRGFSPDEKEVLSFTAGIDSREEERADHALRGYSVEGMWQWQVTSALGVSARGGVLDLEVGSGRNDSVLDVHERFVPALTPRAPEQPVDFTYGAGIVHDTRLEPGAPENGHLLGIGIRRYSASDVRQLSFTRVTYDIRGHRRPLSERGVPLARASTCRNRALPRHRHGRAVDGSPVAGLIQDEPGSGHSRPHQPTSHWAARLGLEFRELSHPGGNRACFLDAFTERSWHVA
jgi:hypothetical protein